MYSEKSTTIIDVPKTYNACRRSYNQQELEKGDVFNSYNSIATSDKQKLIPDNFDCFPRMPVNLQWKNLTFKSKEGKWLSIPI